MGQMAPNKVHIFFSLDDDGGDTGNDMLELAHDTSSLHRDSKSPGKTFFLAPILPL